MHLPLLAALFFVWQKNACGFFAERTARSGTRSKAWF
jgi:hypothetical protein